MQPLVRETGQFRNPLSNIVSVGIKLLALQDRIEDSEIRCRIGTATGYPLPACRVVREIGIDERIPEPSRAILPRDEKMLDEK